MLARLLLRSQHEKDSDILYKIQSFFGVGAIYHRPDRKKSMYFFLVAKLLLVFYLYAKYCHNLRLVLLGMFKSRLVSLFIDLRAFNGRVRNLSLSHSGPLSLSHRRWDRSLSLYPSTPLTLCRHFATLPCELNPFFFDWFLWCWKFIYSIDSSIQYT